jgi:four helix bundle protein
MFDFERLETYKKAKLFNSHVQSIAKTNNVREPFKKQLVRASLSIVLNLAEGSGRFSPADRKNFYVIARSSLFESMALLDVLKDEQIIDESTYSQLHELGTSISKMIYTMIKNLIPRQK